MFPFSGKKNSPPPTPRWMIWGMIGFLVLVIASAIERPSPDQPSAFEQAATNIKSELPIVEDYKKFLPEGVTIDHTVIEKGSALPVMCGQRLMLTIQAYAEGAPTGGARQAEVRVGDDAAPAFVKMLLSKGLSVGSKQRFVFSKKQKLSTVNPEAVLDAMVDTVEVSVTGAKPDMQKAFQEGHLNIQLFDTRAGSGALAACNDAVKVRVDLWDAEGRKIFSNADEKSLPVEFAIGSQSVMLGLEQSVIGMGVGAGRTVVLPPEWQQVTGFGDAKLPKELRKRGQQVIIASILRVE